jgi:hypothetical protein
MSACYVKIPRKKKGDNIVYAGTSYYCRTDGTFVVAGPAEQ